MTIQEVERMGGVNSVDAVLLPEPALVVTSRPVGRAATVPSSRRNVPVASARAAQVPGAPARSWLAVGRALMAAGTALALVALGAAALLVAHGQSPGASAAIPTPGPTSMVAEPPVAAPPPVALQGFEAFVDTLQGDLRAGRFGTVADVTLAAASLECPVPASLAAGAELACLVSSDQALDLRLAVHVLSSGGRTFQGTLVTPWNCAAVVGTAEAEALEVIDGAVCP